MTKLLGSEAVNTSTGRSVKVGKIYACKFSGSLAGTLEELVIKLGVAQEFGGVWMGIYEDAAGFPGTLLEQVKVEAAEGAVVGEQLLAATGFKSKIKLASPYWLAAVSVRAFTPLIPITSAEPGEENQRRSNASTFTAGLVELAAEGWTALINQGPELFYGNGKASPTVHSPGTAAPGADKRGLVEASQKGGA